MNEPELKLSQSLNSVNFWLMGGYRINQ
jgi:hypothetical protein